jgi:hypothetical protein
MNIRGLFADKEKRRRSVTASLMVVFFTCLLLLVWAFSAEVLKPAGFGTVSARKVENLWRLRLSARLPGVYREPSADEDGKFPYSRFSRGDTMYCTYFGLLNIREEPDAGSPVVARVSYGDSIQVFWKESTGYVRVRYQKPYSADLVEGYCVIEELSESAPADGRVFLDIPDYKQYDSRWGALPLGDSYETIASAGCATSCLAMSYSYLEGAVTTPDGMATRLYYDEHGRLGFPKVYEKDWDSDYLEHALTQLRRGVPVLIGGFTEDDHPHWVLITGYIGDGIELKASDFLINDPASEERPTLAEYLRDYPVHDKIVYYKGEV